MGATITLEDLLRIILYLAGAGALIFLALVLKKVLGILGKVQEIVEKNQYVIDDTMKKIPAISDDAIKITANVSSISSEANELLTNVKPEVEKLAQSVGGVSNTVNNVTRNLDLAADKVTGAVSNVTDTVNDTAKTIHLNANNVVDYFYILKEVIEVIKTTLFGK